MKLIRAWVFPLMPAIACLSAPAAELEKVVTTTSIAAVKCPPETGKSTLEAADPFPADPAFDRYCDPTDFVAAMRRVDAEGALDFALQLAHGETILGRERKGLSADHALAAALIVATETKCAPSIERCRRAAERYGKNELLAKLAAGQKLGSASRDDTPPRTVNVLETGLEQFSDLKAIEKQLRILKLSADSEFGNAVKSHIEGAPSLSKEQKQELGTHCSRLIADADDKAAKPANPLIKRLATPVRGSGMDGSWDTSYVAADGSTVEAAVQINGDSGTYDVPGCQGELYNIRASAPFGGGPMVVRGQWRFCGGETGSFSWSVDGDGFRGYWMFSGGGSPARQWNGQRSDDGDGGGGTDPSETDGGSGGEIEGTDGGTDGGEIDGGTDGGTDFGGTDPGTNGGGTDPTDSDAPGFQSDSGSNFGGGELSASVDVGQPFNVGDFRADNGSTIALDSGGSAVMANSFGTRVAGRLQTNGDGTVTANFNIGGKYRPATIRVLNPSQIQVGRTVFTRQ